MENKIAGLLGAIAALGTLGAAQASPAPTHNPSEALTANSYADLLEPIPNAAKILRALDEAPPKAAEDSADANVKVAWRHHHHHHHHHHHGYWRHHHHHHGYWRHHHHHHHHHHHGYYRR
jgi:hypothetical protein